ncbi:MAG: O-antigen polysaccharide polymerase Wzy family protein [Spirochaetia bacterium]|nr:O-antigen polysaccharide polymerase Wzy family protein [Spirochaetia bacterium]
MQIENFGFYFYVVSMPALVFLGVVLGFWTQPYSFIPACFCFIIFYFSTVIRAIKNYGLFSLYAIYLYTSFFFIYSRLFFSLFGIIDFLYVDFPGHYYFSEKTGIVFIIGSFISFYLLDIFYCIKRYEYEKKVATFYTTHLIYSSSIERLGICLMLLSFLPISYKLYLEFQVIKDVGYVAMYTGALDNLVYPVWTRGSGTIFYVGFLLLIMSYPRKSLYIFGSLFFTLFRIFDALKGGRGALIVSILAIIFFYQQFYGVRINFKKFFLLALLLSLFASFTGTYRTTKNTQGTLSFKQLGNFFINQSISVGSPLAVIEFRDEQEEFRQYPYIFSVLMAPYYNLVSPETARTPSIERLYTRNEMESISTYIYSEETYLAGFGIGASFLGEMFDCFGFGGISFWSFMLGYLLLLVDKMKYKSRFYIPFVWFVVCSVIFLPRGHFFDFIYSGYFYFILIEFLCFLISFLCFPKKIFI